MVLNGGDALFLLVNCGDDDGMIVEVENWKI